MLGRSRSDENTIQFQSVCPRKPGESPRAYRACADYCLSGRSQKELIAFYRAEKSNPNPAIDPPTLYERTIIMWSCRFGWIERKKIWEDKRIEIRSKREAEAWEDYCDRLAKNAIALSEKAELMIKHPHIKKVVQETYTALYAGEVIPVKVIFEPAKWNFNTAGDYLSKSADLMKMSLGVDKEVWAVELLLRLGYNVSRPQPESATPMIESPTYIDLSRSVANRN